MGNIGKIILQDICATLRIVLNIYQWRSTEDCIKWFKNLEKKWQMFFY